MLTLVHAPKSRSTRFIWLLEELGAPYEVMKVDIKRAGGEMAGSGARDPRNPHPHGQVPALLDGDALIYESAAIALYLTDKFPQVGLGPLVGDAKRGAYLSWLAYYAGVLEPSVTNHWKGRTASDEGDRQTYDILANHLRDTLRASPWLLGDNFSAADILFTSPMLFARELLPDYPEFDDYLVRATARPALARAMGRDDA
ncbi:glutathione S-transferase family protein [Phenylobacterium sp.]|jgi:glutathione S-transferase|uniref:glutathione S-transferase family protein n=1 Tax=Phenylobacterium sp. TaxID=1871053 RepID=UPI0035AF41D1